MSTEPTPYRLPIADPPKPVCAKCQHRADAKVQDPTEPWRSWFCLATTKQVWPEQYNPLTGETRAAVMGWERCVDMNGEGQCTKFAPLPETTFTGETALVPTEPRHVALGYEEPATEPFRLAVALGVFVAVIAFVLTL